MFWKCIYSTEQAKQYFLYKVRQKVYHEISTQDELLLFSPKIPTLFLKFLSLFTQVLVSMTQTVINRIMGVHLDYTKPNK